MALNSGSQQFSLFELQWRGQVAAFNSDNHGKSIQLSEQGTQASRTGGVSDWGHGLVCTRDPVVVGKMLKVTVMKRHSIISFGGLGLGFTTDTSNLHSSLDIMRVDFPDKDGYVYLDSNKLKYKGESLSSLDFSTYHLKTGQSVGILLTKKRDLHWFVDDEWRGSAQLTGYPLDKEVWGLVDVCARCTCVKAEILSVSGYKPEYEEQLVLMGLISSKFSDRTATVQPGLNESRLDLLQESIMKQIQDEISAQTEQLQYQLSQEQTTVQVLKEENDSLKQELDSMKSRVSVNDLEFWQVSPEELIIREDQVLGRGAWGYVTKGLFRGTPVAIKRVYPEIFQQTTLKRIRREISTMAQIRHPNLVLFIAAILKENTGPIILTELLDTSLRVAYQSKRLGPNKRKIFIDIASALAYLHGQREPVIHRDVSTANVLLVALPNNTWLAKLSDFGSANLARDATTPGEGAIVYTAPEAFPQHPVSPRPPPKQTTKIDVYSFGVLVCEVTTCVFPSTDKLGGLIDALHHSWPDIHPLASRCISFAPEDRPTMATVLNRLKELTSEP